MNCEETNILIHSLIDGELDAVNTRAVEEHADGCASCTGKMASYRALRAEMGKARLKETAPARLRNRIELALPLPAAAIVAPAQSVRPSRRAFFGGFAGGAALSAAIAASVVLIAFRNDQEQMIASDVVSAHIRSLQGGHLMDVETSDQHTVKPWFNGKLDVSPPVTDLTAEGFTLLGGRLDYIDGEPVAAIVYQRRKHVINLFVAQRLGRRSTGVSGFTVLGYNVRNWSQGGLDFWAVSDLAAPELDEFVQKVSAAAARSASGPA